jgi:receptor protein-tyrosine kinase
LDLSRVFATIRRRWWILILTIVVGAACGFVLTRLETPQYTATTRLFVSTTGGTSSTESYSGEQFSQQRTASYAQMITSALITQRVVNQLDLPMSADELSSHVTATVVPRTVLLDVSATDASPRRAADIANTLAQKFIDFAAPLETPVGQEQPRSTITVVSDAKEPTTASSPHLGTNLFYGILGGFAVGLVGLIMAALLSSRIHSADELKTLTRTTVFGPLRIPDRTRQERREQVAAAYNVDADEVRRLRVQIEAQDPVPQVLLLAPVTDGRSALNLAVDLALSFAEAGRTTVLVCTSSEHDQMAGELRTDRGGAGLADLLTGAARADDVISATARQSFAVVAPGSSEELASMLSSPAMSGFIDELRKRFDRVILITTSVARSSGSSVLSAVVDANLLVVDSHAARRGSVTKALTESKAARAHLMGMVLVQR